MKSQWTGLVVWLRGYICLLCKHEDLSSNPSTHMKSCTCLSWQHCRVGRQVDQNLLASQPSWTASRGRHQSHALTPSSLYMDTQKCYTRFCMCHTVCVCACIYIYMHIWKNTSLGWTGVVSYDYCNLSTLDAEAGDPHIRGQQWCIKVCTYLNRKEWSNLKIECYETCSRAKILICRCV